MSLGHLGTLARSAPAFVAVLALFASGCAATIEHGLEEPAANEIVTSLERGGIPANKRRLDDGVFTVSVAAADAVPALELLRSLGLPRGRRPGLAEIYKSSSLLPTPTEERARYVEALAGELAATLETIDGVALARVHLVLPEPDPLAIDGKPRSGAQAAVLLKLRPGQAAPLAEADVQRLVAGSVAGLAPASVSVVFTPATAAPSGPPSLAMLGPLRMTPGSRRVLLAAGAIALLLLAALAVLVLLLARRLAAAQRQRSAALAPTQPPPTSG